MDSLVSAVLAAAAAAMCASYVYRTMWTSHPSDAPRPNNPVVMRDWKEALAAGQVISGDSSSSNTVVEFGDLECPACRRFNIVLDSVTRQRRLRVRTMFVHFPLSYHRFALPAARGAECARQAGRARQWIQIIYAQQDSLGLKPWNAFAREAGISDTDDFAACVKRAAPVPRIEAGTELGRRIPIEGTPAIAVNGWLFPRPPSPKQLDSALTATTVTAVSRE